MIFPVYILDGIRNEVSFSNKFGRYSSNFDKFPEAKIYIFYRTIWNFWLRLLRKMILSATVYSA